MANSVQKSITSSSKLASPASQDDPLTSSPEKSLWLAFTLMVAFFAIAPIWVYPVFLMKVMCFALFACAFNLLLGFGGFWVSRATAQLIRQKFGAGTLKSLFFSARFAQQFYRSLLDL